ncbi:MAG: hypothetical protein AAB877_01175 [Patescibacteria group bacterium]
MINLLPPKEKERLLQEKNLKLAVILGNIVLVSIISLILVLVSVKFYILSQAEYHKTALSEIEKKYKTPEFLFFDNYIKTQNVKLQRVDNFLDNQSSFADSVKLILDIERPPGLSFSNILMHTDKESGNKIKTSISGFVDNRENLLIFKKNIENSQKIKNINFPPNNWIKPENIEFFLSFEII